MNNRDQWKELGIDPKYLYHEQSFDIYQRIKVQLQNMAFGSRD